jgi:serine protease inhibitor
MSLSGPGRELRSANALWVRQDIPLQPDYEADMAAHAGAALHRVSSRWTRSFPARDQPLVAGRTNDRIDELIAEGVITMDTGAVLVNAIYWKGAWHEPFSAEATRTEPFFKTGGAQAATALMNQQAYFRVLERGGVKVIDLPYEGGEVSMVILLPDNRDGLPRLERKLTPRQLGRWLEGLEEAAPLETILTLPKMNLDWNADLAKVMQAMGAPTRSRATPTSPGWRNFRCRAGTRANAG